MSRDSLETRPTTWMGETSTSGRTAAHWLTIRSTASSLLPCHVDERSARRLDSHYLKIKIMNMKDGPGERPAERTAGATCWRPITWGTTYVAVTELLPAGRPLLVATVRVVPAGLVLLAVGAAELPLAAARRGVVADGRLAACNFGFFFPLLVVAVYRLPGGVAAAMGGLQPLLVALLSALVTGRRPRPGRPRGRLRGCARCRPGRPAPRRRPRPRRAAGGGRRQPLLRRRASC